MCRTRKDGTLTTGGGTSRLSIYFQRYGRNPLITLLLEELRNKSAGCLKKSCIYDSGIENIRFLLV